MKESVLISQLKSLRAKWEPGPAIGVHSQSRWQGPSEIRLDDEKWRVAQCDSVLELRQRLAEESSVPLVLITSLPTAAVGDDVRARLFKQRLVDVDPWNSLAERYKARQVDPVLRQSPALADVVLEALGTTEPPIAASGILTPELVWQVVLQNRLGLNNAKPDLLDFLPWIAGEGAVAKWESLGEPLQKQLADWLALSLGEMGAILIRTLQDGYGPDAIAAGFALGALTGAGADSRAMGRLERLTGGRPLSANQIRQWNEISERWATRETVERVRQELARADQILESVGAIDTAIESRWSPNGFQQRLAAFAEELVAGDSRKLQRAWVPVSSHEGSRFLEELRGRRERAEMVMRLVRWIERPLEKAATLFDAVARYEQDGSWVDWARHQLLAGDEPEGVSRAYRKLFDKVTARLDEENRRFGELLVASTAANSAAQGVLLVEDVLSTIVAPLVKSAPAGVLFIVMDGMSLPVWHELSEDLAKHGWQEWAPENGAVHRCAVTVLPSATNFSRASLLCGGLVTGAQNVEKRGFQENPELRAWKPVLFHKDEVGSSGADLSEALRMAVVKNEPKLVGVVLNVIDDSLGGPEQLSIQWNLRSIAVLQTMLSEARSAGRVVVLASDHGHVLDHASKLNRKADGADRWRPASPGAEPGPDELLAQGTRVLAEGGRIIAPTSESMRYTPNRRLGYHGGLTAQECVAPIAVLAPAVMAIPGWEVLPTVPPDWWFDGEAAQVERASATKTGKRTTKRKDAALPLFDPAKASADWVNLLLESSVFQDQMATFAGRLKQDQVEKSLRVLEERNLVLLKSAFAQRVEMSGLRVDGLIASLQRILNVESYPVLSVDASQTLRLNLQLLREQFELGDPDGR
jgi:hypothetical protein